MKSTRSDGAKPIEYEIRLPKGQYTISDAAADPEVLEITGDAPEAAVDLMLMGQKSYGAVVAANAKTFFRKEGEAILPVARAILEEDRGGSNSSTVSNENGDFTLITTNPNDLAIFVRTRDFSLVGLTPLNSSPTAN